MLSKIQDGGHIRISEGWCIFLDNQGPKSKFFAKFQNFSTFCKAKPDIDWTTCLIIIFIKKNSLIRKVNYNKNSFLEF